MGQPEISVHDTDHLPGIAQRFGLLARRQQALFRRTLSATAQSPDDPVGLRNGHLLAHGYEVENLYPVIRGAGGALSFFQDRRIKWWTNARSGDRPLDPTYRGPTRNLASSQVSCVNFLLPLSLVDGGLLRFIKCLDKDATEVLPIVDQEGRVSLVEFEWVGWEHPLEGGAVTRGANQTSVDAVIVARTGGNRVRAYLIEWKYCEEYLRSEDKSVGRAGITRRNRYLHLYSDPDSPFQQTIPFEHFLFEPYYQIMRLLLLAREVERKGLTPDIHVDEARVVVVCPLGNEDYRKPAATTPLALAGRFPFTSVEDVVCATLQRPGMFAMLSPEEVLASLRAESLDAVLTEWLAYHHARYGW